MLYVLPPGEIPVPWHLHQAGWLHPPVLLAHQSLVAFARDFMLKCHSVCPGDTGTGGVLFWGIYSGISEHRPYFRLQVFEGAYLWAPSTLGGNVTDKPATEVWKVDLQTTELPWKYFKSYKVIPHFRTCFGSHVPWEIVFKMSLVSYLITRTLVFLRKYVDFSG